jgi:hypothetical protein
VPTPLKRAASEASGSFAKLGKAAPPPIEAPDSRPDSRRTSVPSPRK